MCEIRMRRVDRWHEVTATGHAEGSAQVCAAVSGLMYALAGYLLNAKRRGLARVEELRLDSGDARLEWLGKPRTEAAFDMAAVGLEQLAKGNPQCVRVEVTEG